ncbi:telomere-protecting terminal protein Tpg [Embleya sp. NPDC020630]|uniref:telomere-protecting terminal protein Tpg n=1 Tax=Embleya sp. NPDC020630 TaxID=3363979 RepID=UPI0037988F24
MGKIGDGLDQAAQHVLTRKPPKSTKARVRFLMSKNQGRTHNVAAVLGVSQRTIERYLKGDRKHPPPVVAARIDAEVRRLWQPQVRWRARAARSRRGRRDRGDQGAVRVLLGGRVDRRPAHAPHHPTPSPGPRPGPGRPPHDSTIGDKKRGPPITRARWPF